MIEINVTGNAQQQLRAIDTQAQKTDYSIKNLIGSFASFYTAEKAIRSVITTFADMQQSLLDIQKTTGLAGKGLEDLTNSLNELSTTNRGMEVESLYKIASIAGQLGIKGKENILNFTTEIKKLAVTSSLTAEQAGEAFAQLSNSLGEPISNIRKLSSTFTALASNTTASEEVLVNFVQRLSGAGKTLGLTTAQISGLGATLKDVGLTAELSTTAMSQVFMKLLTDTKKITDTMGLDFKEFSRIVKEEPNKALLIFLESLGKLDKASKVQALKDMQMAGAGLSSTLLKLSDNTQLLVKNMNIASEAYVLGTATQQEYDIASQSLRAKQEQLTSAFKLSAYALGKELEPSLNAIISALVPMVQYVGQNSAQFIQLAKVIGVATVAWKTMNIVMNASPFARVVAGLTAIITVAYKAYGAIKQLMAITAQNAKIQEDYAKKLANGYVKDTQYLGGLLKESESNKRVYDDIIKRQKALTTAIAQTSKILSSNNSLTAKQKDILAKNLAKQKETLNNLKFQRKELEKTYKYLNAQTKKSSGKSGGATKGTTPTGGTVDIKVPKVEIPKVKIPKVEIPKVKIPKIDTKEISKVATALKRTNSKIKADSIKTSKTITKAHKSAYNALLAEQKRVNEAFANDYLRATLSQYDYERAKLKEQYNNYSKHVKDKSKLNAWYQAELKKINDKEKSEEKRKQEELLREQQRANEERLRLQRAFELEYQRSTLPKWEYDLKRLEEQKQEYIKQGQDLLKVGKWYSKEREKIVKERDKKEKEAIQKRLDEELKAIQKQAEEQRKINEQLAKEINGYLGTLSSVLIDVGFKVDKSALDSLIGDISKLIAEGVNEGFKNANYSTLATSVGGVLASAIAKTYAPNATKSQQVGGNLGGAIGGAVGTSLGGAIGGSVGSALGQIVGGWASGKLFGGKKTQYVYINSSGTATVVERTDKGVFRKDKWKAKDIETLQLQQSLDSQFTAINSVFDALSLNIDFSLNNLYESLGGVEKVYKIKAKNLDKELSRALLEEMGGNSEQLYKIWSNYAKSIDKQTLEALGQSLSSLTNAENKIFEYLNRDNKSVVLEKRLDTLNKTELALEQAIGMGDVTLENYEEVTKKLLETGKATPKTTQALQQLADILIQQAQIQEDLKESGEGATTTIKGLSVSIKELNKSNVEAIKESQKLKDDISSSFYSAISNSAFYTPSTSPFNNEVDTRKTYNQLVAQSDLTNIDDIVRLAQFNDIVKREEDNSIESKLDELKNLTKEQNALLKEILETDKQREKLAYISS